MSGTIRRSARRLPGRTVLTKALCILIYVALAWLFGGTAGLAIGVAVVLARWAFALPVRYLWIAAITALAAAPVATIAQGLPTSSVVGPEFGEHHIAAHVLVGVSMALAAFAGLLDADRLRWRPPRQHRIRGAIAARRGRGAAVAASAGNAAPTPVVATSAAAVSRRSASGRRKARPSTPPTPKAGAGAPAAPAEAEQGRLIPEAADAGSSKQPAGEASAAEPSTPRRAGTRPTRSRQGHGRPTPRTPRPGPGSGSPPPQ